ncbi:MAG: hypothetical protein CMI05_00460 [Oceanospirillaceae bacterium]|nr:hypothetical protein [Oceanospirillaceae bacterium]
MLRIVDLRDYKKPTALDATLRDALLEAFQIKESIDRSKAMSFLLYLEVFLDCYDRKLSFVDLNMNLNKLFADFFAFVNLHFDLSLVGKYSVIHNISDAIYIVCDQNEIQRPALEAAMSRSMSPGIERCIRAFKPSSLNKDKLKYYEGWYAESSDYIKVKLYLHRFYLHFGDSLTEALFQSMKNHYRRYPGSTVKYKAKVFVKFLDALILLFKEEGDFYEGGRARNVTSTVEQVFIVSKLDAKIKGNDLRYFYKEWASIVKIVNDILISSGLWDKPLYDFIVPEFKSASNGFKTHRKVVDGNLYSSKLITDIPLSYTDKKAMSSLLISLDDDISHVVSAARRAVKKIMHGYNMRLKNADEGIARPGTINHFRDASYVDVYDDRNQCANWEKYNYYLEPNDVVVGTFLGVKGKADKFVDTYSIIQNGMFYPFLYLLIYEHPIITNSWLESFQIYDKHGNQVGFIESNNSSLAIGYKPRRSAAYAEQKVVLNDTSKYLFDCLIKLTEQARKYLKKNNDSNYRYLLISGVCFGKPNKIKSLRSQKVFVNSCLNRFLLEPSEYADITRAEVILSNLTLSKFRASRAIQIYIKTNSIEAISEALGHKKPCPRLLERYLPDPVLKFFQDRWIRIFQNAIIYEAMKDSVFLFDSIDISENDLEEFLKNHRFDPLPNHIVNGQLDDLSFLEEDSKAKDSRIIIPLSESLLISLKCIVKLVDDHNDGMPALTKTALQWFETAKFVSKSLEESKIAKFDPEISKIVQASDDIEPFVSKFRGAVYEK